MCMCFAPEVISNLTFTLFEILSNGIFTDLTDFFLSFLKIMLFLKFSEIDKQKNAFIIKKGVACLK